MFNELEKNIYRLQIKSPIFYCAGYLFILWLFFSCKVVNQAPMKQNLNRLTNGRWVSVQDPNEIWQVKNGLNSSSYLGLNDAADTSYYSLSSQNCDTSYSGDWLKDLQFFVLTSKCDSKELCYIVDACGKNYLRLTYMSRGNTLTFWRNPSARDVERWRMWIKEDEADTTMGEGK